MTQNDAIKWHKCALCEYQTKRKFDLKRHHNAKHFRELQSLLIQTEDVQKVNLNVQKVNPSVQKVNPNVQKVNPRILCCTKCNKVYKTQRHLLNHEKKCNKVDSLTCPRCMVSFTKKQAKSRHIKENKCKARSIIHARLQNSQNIQNITNNNIDNSVNKTVNNILINNFGSERIDHITHKDIVKMLTSGENTIPLYIKKKHFNKNFPENNNIKYSNDNKCQVLEDNCWQEKDIGLLSTNLMKDNTEVLLMYCDNNEIQLFNEISDIEKYEHIRNKLFIVYNKSDNQKYNAVLAKIKELIKSSTLEFEN